MYLLRLKHFPCMSALWIHVLKDIIPFSAFKVRSYYTMCQFTNFPISKGTSNSCQVKNVRLLRYVNVSCESLVCMYYIIICIVIRILDNYVRTYFVITAHKNLQVVSNSLNGDFRCFEHFIYWIKTFFVTFCNSFIVFFYFYYSEGVYICV